MQHAAGGVGHSAVVGQLTCRPLTDTFTLTSASDAGGALGQPIAGVHGPARALEVAGSPEMAPQRALLHRRESDGDGQVRPGLVGPDFGNVHTEISGLEATQLRDAGVPHIADAALGLESSLAAGAVVGVGGGIDVDVPAVVIAEEQARPDVDHC